MNDDLISRQAAIDALKQLQKNISGDYTELDPMVMAGCGYIGDCIGEIEDLPSAQQWIPVSERLPENGHYYLWCSDMGSVQSDYYWNGFENGQKYGYNIVAWMPLPEPYRKEQE